jgi:Cu2+-exporting ATPase
MAPACKVAYQKAVVERKFSYYAHLGPIYALGMYASGLLPLAAVTFLAIGVAYKLTALSEANMRSGVVSFFDRQPRNVWCMVDGVETEIPFEQIARGDILVCYAGQMVPSDGLVVSGAAAVDEHMLTGESQPAEKGVGDTVLAATVVLSGRILVEVREAGNTTTVAKIADILNHSASYHLSLQETIAVIAERSVPAVLAGSGLALLLSGPIGAISMMGSNFTLNMVGVVPYTLLRFLNRTSQAGVLVKEGVAMETLPNIDTMVFDKTGTLTLKQPHLVAIYTAGTLGTTEILRLAAAAEQRQSHPIAKAILAAAAEHHIELPPMMDARYEIGYGLAVHLPEIAGSADAGGVQRIHVGSTRFMRSEGIVLPEDLLSVAAHCHERGTALVWVAREGVVVGALELETTVRSEAS